MSDDPRAAFEGLVYLLSFDMQDDWVAQEVQPLAELVRVALAQVAQVAQVDVLDQAKNPPDDPAS